MVSCAFFKEITILTNKNFQRKHIFFVSSVGILGFLGPLLCSISNSNSGDSAILYVIDGLLSHLMLHWLIRS